MALCLCLMIVIGADAATFTANLDRDTITLGESVSLSLTFEGGTPSQLPGLPAIPNLQVAGSGTSMSTSFINGQSTSSTSYNFIVTPSQPGNYTIPALAANVGGQKLTTQPLVLKVLKPTAPPPDVANSGAQDAFLKLVLPKKEVYVGETFTGQIEIYLASRVLGVGAIQLTGFPADGFNVGKMIEGQRRSVQINNGVYTVIPAFVALKAIKAGPLTIGPVTFNLVLELPSANRQRDPFDPFGFFGSRNEQKQVAIASDAMAMQSLPLPRENVPPSFNGAVGNYSLSMTAGPTNVAAGDPITVKVQISGHGSLDSLLLPEQPAWHDFKTYPPTVKVDTVDKLGTQGTKTFEEIIVPQNAEIKELPPISFSFFDPDQKAYRTLTHPALPLLVRGAGAEAAPSFLAASRGPEDNAPPAQGIVPNKQRLGTVAQLEPPLLKRGWFLALQGVPLLALVSAFVWRRRAEKLANNPQIRRRRTVSRRIRHGLEELRQQAQQNQSEQFFATLFRLLQEQLGERLDLPASAITESVAEERLRPQGVGDEMLAPLQELFQACNLARYAPIRTSQELTAMIPKVQDVLRQLQELRL